MFFSHLSTPVTFSSLSSSSPLSSVTPKWRKHCAFFKATTRRLVLTHTQMQAQSDRGEKLLYPPLHQPVTLLRCKFECQLPFSLKAMSARWKRGMLKSGNGFCQIVVFTFYVESSWATGTYTPRRDKCNVDTHCRKTYTQTLQWETILCDCMWKNKTERN